MVVFPSASFINNHDEKSMVEQEDQMLIENGLFRVEVEESENVFSVFSKAFFQTEDFKDYFQEMCLSYLTNLLLNEQMKTKISRQLKMFCNNSQLLLDYFEHITEPAYDLINFEILSLLFQSKILIYHFDSSSYLQATILNNSSSSHLLFFKSSSSAFFPLLSLQQAQKHLLLKPIILQIIDQILSPSFPIQPSYPPFSSISLSPPPSFCTPSSPLSFLPPTLSPLLLSPSANFPPPPSPLLLPPHPSPLLPPTTSILPSSSSLNISPPSFVPHHSLSPSSLPLPSNLPAQTINPIPSILSPPCLPPPPSSSSSPLTRSKCSFEEEKRRKSGLSLDSKVFLIEDKKKMEKRQPLILEESHERFFGILKFFDESKAYGFIIMENNSEVFVHYDDFEKKEQTVTKDFLASYKFGNIIKVEFSLMKYIGRYNVSRKAVEVKVVEG